jgi:uncharacterized protein YjbJ (UPF0337 family)
MGSREGAKVTDGAGNLVQQIQEQTQNLAQQIQEQTLKSARGFYGDSLGSLKGQLEDDRYQLQDLLDQLPESQQDARARLEEMVESYEAIENSLDEVAQQQGVEDAVDRAAQQAQEAAGQAQDVEAPAVKSSRRDKVRGAATSAAGKASEIAGSLTGDRRTGIKGFLARRKGAFDQKKGESKELLDQ